MRHVLLLESHACKTGITQSRERVWATLRPSWLQVRIIYRTVKFTTSFHAVTALYVCTVGTWWWQGHYTFTFLLRKIWQLQTYILTFSTSVSVISKHQKHTSCTWHTHTVFILWYLRQPAVWVTSQYTSVFQPAMSLTSTRTCSPLFTTWCNWNVVIPLNSCQHVILVC